MASVRVTKIGVFGWFKRKKKEQVLAEAIVDFYLAGKKVNAIKRLRRDKEIGLKEAKVEMDFLFTICENSVLYGREKMVDKVRLRLPPLE